MTTKRPGAHERGSILLMVMIFILMLSMLGALTLRTVGLEMDVVGAERQAEHALYTAEAGIAWGRVQLLQYGADHIDYNAMFGALTVIHEPGQPLDGWYEVGSESYAGGTFRVAVKDDAISEVPGPGNDTILMRSLGLGPGGAQGAERLIETTLLGE